MRWRGRRGRREGNRDRRGWREGDKKEWGDGGQTKPLEEQKKGFSAAT